MKLLKAGNLKIDKSCGVFCLPTEVCTTQCPGCYAKKAERQYPAVLPSRRAKLEATKRADFVDVMVAEIKKAGFKTVRIHESGDFYAPEYILKWVKIVKQCPEVQFYAFTKTLHFNLHRLNELGNCNIIFERGINYGGPEKVEELKAQGYYECPCKKGVKVACMKDCRACLTETKVAFHKH